MSPTLAERREAMHAMLRADPEAAMEAVLQVKICGPRVEVFAHRSWRVSATGHQVCAVANEGRGWFPVDLGAQQSRDCPRRSASRAEVEAFADAWAVKEGWILVDPQPSDDGAPPTFL